MNKQTVMVVGNTATGLFKAAPQLAGDHIVVGIDPAAPNGDHSALAVMKGQNIHQVIFDELANFEGDPRQLKPMVWGNTVTGRSRAYNPPIWQVPKNPCAGEGMDSRTNKIYLFRGMQIVYEYSGKGEALGDAHDAGQPGDIALTISYMGKYRMFYWRGKKKHYWRPVSTNKKPELLAMLKAALLLQS